MSLPLDEPQAPVLPRGEFAIRLNHRPLDIEDRMAAMALGSVGKRLLGTKDLSCPWYTRINGQMQLH